MGRPWLATGCCRTPTRSRQLWVNFRSPLLWDVFAISTYFTISLVFWYIGLIPTWPPCATAPARAQEEGLRHPQPRLERLVRPGSRYEEVYLLLAGMATPLVFSCTRS
jgi:hypothetical protein